MKKIYSLLILGCLSCLTTLSVKAQTTTYSTGGTTNNYTVPSGITAVAVDVAGASGGLSDIGNAGGKGGRVVATLAVTPGMVLYCYVGNVGGNGCYCGTPAGGANGSGGGANGGSGSGGGGGGGGASDIRIGGTALSNRVVVGAGGGAGSYACGEVGGDGGGSTGTNGNECGSFYAGACGVGGTQSGGGAGGTYGASSGGLGYGGAAYSAYYGGGGGGGYYGGGGGFYGSGGGGSSYPVTGATTAYASGVTNTAAYQSAHAGYVKITPLAPTVAASPTSLAFGAVTTSTTSSPMLFALSGSILTGTPLTITAPANFQISPDGTTWYNSSTSYTYTYSGSSFSTIFYVEFLPTAVTSYSGNITVTGGGLTATYNVAVTGTGAAPCSGTPTAGSATINGVASASGNSSTSFTLNAPTATVAGGITYQWQSCPTVAGTYVNVPGANSISYTFTGLSSTTYYRCLVSCGANTATSGTVYATFTLPASSCTPSSSYSPCGSYQVGTSGSPVIINGASGTSISDASTCGSGTGGSSYYYNNVSTTVTFNPGGNYTSTIGGGYYYSSGQIWIDFNNSGTFETSESVGGYLNNSCCGTGTRASAPISIPSGVTPGAYRMRVENDYTGSYGPGGYYYYPAYPQMNPCPASGTVYEADTRDYTAIIQLPTPSLTATTPSSFGTVAVGASSMPVAFSLVSGSALLPATGLITVTAPSGFLVSTNGTTWVSSLTLAYAGGVLNAQNVYIQFNPTSATSYSGNVAFTGGGIPSTVNIAVSGIGVSSVCSGTPTAGTAAVSPSSGSSSTVFTLSLSGASTSGGLTFQWQSSPTGTTWTNIPGAFYSSYTFTGISATTQYRCIVGCGTGATATSSTTTATSASGAMAASSCTPAFAYTCSSYPMSTSINTLAGASGTISDPGGCGANYVDNTGTMSVTLNASTTYPITYGVSTSYYSSFTVQTWIDFNNDGIFQSSESVGGLAQGGATSPVQTSTIVIPGGVPSGTYRMRVVGAYCPSCYGFSGYPSLTPCPTTAIYYGNARDYKVILVGGAPPCSGTPLAGIVNASQTTSCGAFTTNLFNVGVNTSPGMVYQWQSSTSPTTGFTNVSGATNASYTPTISTVGTIYYRDSATCTTTGATGNSKTPAQQLIYNAAPTPITGTTTVCNGTNSTLGSTPSGGTWSSDNIAVASIGTSGVAVSASAGTANITYTAPTGCITSVPFIVNPQPSAITGTTTFCGSQTTSLSSSPFGGTWTSSNTGVATTAGSASGTITGISTGGTANITYTLPTGCIAATSVSVNPLSPITGTPSMCLGYGTTLADATSGGTWNSSSPGVASINSSGVMSSSAIGTTTVSYTMPTGCMATQVVAVTNPPTGFTVTGGGHFCTHGSGVTVGLSGTNAGISYQLYNGATPIGAPIIGAGFGISFGLDTLAGVYGVIAGVGACQLTMPNTVTISLDPLPTPFTVSGSNGGTYCAGGTGAHVFLNSSTIGVNYQLFNGTTPVGSAISGTSGVLDFGLQTIGSYSIVGTNTVTGCVGNMGNVLTVTTTPVPSVFSMSSSAGYCAGGSGVPVTLSGSTAGVSYQLYSSGTAVGAPIYGSGGSISFGSITTGGNYTVIATNTVTACTSSMSGTTTVSVNALPTVYTVIGGGAYCVGTTSTVHTGLNASTIGVNYQLYANGVSLGSTYNLSGTGASLDFGAQSTLGAYTVVATNPTTTCGSNMNASVIVTTNPLPTPFTVTGGGSYCSGGTGVVVGLGGSVIGTNYQLYNGTTLTSALSGTGSSLNYGLITAAGSSYNVVATNTATGCVNNMTGSVAVVINPLPVSTYSVTGGGAYCAGGAGAVVGLSSSQSGYSYQTYLGGVINGSAVTGTGAGISFGPRSTTGAYTVVATSTSGCVNNMTGSVPVSISPLPTLYAVTGGGGYCVGSTGVHVGLLGSDVGITYQLLNGTTLAGSLAGTGAALDFGVIGTTGTYTVAATNLATVCTVNMLSSAVVNVNPVPAASTISPSSISYCAGTAGAAISLPSSAIGVNYNLYNSTGTLITTVAGTGSGISFGTMTAGVYNAVAVNASTGCTANMTGVSALTTAALPSVFAVTGGGAYCAGGTSAAHVGLAASSPGISYQLINAGSTISTVGGTGGAIDFGTETLGGTYTVVGSASGCNNNMSGSAVVVVNPLPTAYTVNGGGSYCLGGTGVHVGILGSLTGVNYQVYVSGSPIGTPIAGTGAAIDFGLRTSLGTYTVVATNTATSCVATMPGAPVVSNYPALVSHNITGGGSFCPGGTGVHIGLDSTTTGNSYQVYSGTTAVGSLISGIGGPIDFGTFTTPGTYTVIANNPSTTCSGNMAGSAIVSLYALPSVYTISGGGNYCAGTGGSHIGVAASATSVSYQLYLNGVLFGGPVAGTGSAIDFGSEIATGTYTAIATGTISGCSISMSGSTVVGINPLPAVRAVTGGGNYCIGGTGTHVGLGGSQTGISYQLFHGSTPVGSAIPGTGSALDFGLQTATGTYSVLAVNPATTCSNSMAGVANVGTNPLPTAYVTSRGGSYCAGGAGIDITLSGSDATVNYQLYNGTTPVGSAVAGTGTSLDLGTQTTAGTYMIIATDGTTACNNNMSGTAAIVVNPLPPAYNVTGGGTYCAGTSGTHVMLSGTNTGYTYQLMNGTTSVGSAIAGTGFGIDFGALSVSGTYTVMATNTSTSCMGNMTGNAVVGVNPAPTVFSISGLGSSYCAGGTGIDLSLSGSQTGVNYQLYNGTTTVGTPTTGTGSAIDFGYHTAAGAYTIQAVSTSTACTSNMSGVASIIVNSLPASFTVTGGGSYCAGGTGVPVGLINSNSGMNYQLYRSGSPIGSAVSGTGSAISFGVQTDTGSYTVIATNSVTRCNNAMAGTAHIATNALPASYAITGGGAYCAGGTGLHINTSGSATGIKYQLYNGGSMVGSAISGTGFALDLGAQTAPGTYTVIATNNTTLCASNMTGSGTIVVNPLPNAYTVTGGGNYCAGGTGSHVGIDGSATGVSYQLFNGSTISGSAVAGTGTTVDFGAKTAPGTYTVIATDGTTGCTNEMAGGTTIAVNALPAAFSVIGGGNICAGSAGVHIGLSGSGSGISYQLIDSGASAGTAVIGTGSALDLGAQTRGGAYTVIGTDGSTGCTNAMTGSASIVVNPVVIPFVSITTTGGDTVCTGNLTTFTAAAVNAGTSATYQWLVNGVAASTSASYTYMPSNLDVVTVQLTSSALCAMPATASSSKTITVQAHQMPSVLVSADPGAEVCQGSVVHFSAAPSYGGTAPSYNWIVRGATVSTAATYSYVPTNGDVVYCVLTSNYNCRLANTATSNHENMIVDVATTPVVTITSDPSNSTVAPGQQITFTATVTGGGSGVSYQWFVDGIAVTGATSPVFSGNSFSNLQSVTCMVTTTGACSGLTGTSAPSTVHITNVGVQQVNAAGSNVQLVPNPNKGIFILKGALATAVDEEVTIEVTDMLGQVIYSSKVVAHNGELNEKIQLSNTIANGMYLLNLRSASDNAVFHMVIEQ